MPTNYAYVLFNFTRYMPDALAEVGWQPICFDLREPEHDHMHVQADLSKPHAFDGLPSPGIIVSYPPCTDLAASGANPEFQEKAMRLFFLARRLGGRYSTPWMAESSVEAVSTLYRRPDEYAHPYEYAGWLEPEDRHPDYPRAIAPRDLYPKKTGLWYGNGFKPPERRPADDEAEPEFRGFRKLGGKSDRTKRIRSATPRGMARAIAAANPYRLPRQSSLPFGD